MQLNPTQGFLCSLPESLAFPAPQPHTPLTAAWGPLVAATASLRAPTPPSTPRTQLQHQAALSEVL